jgi:predicted transcriptional regulator
MKLTEISRVIEADFIGYITDSDKEVKRVCGCDLMSDVLSFIKSDALLLTGLTNPQVVRTAEMADVAAVCFVRGKCPPDETVRLAGDKKLPLMATKLTLYECCGRLYREGLQSCDELE